MREILDKMTEEVSGLAAFGGILFGWFVLFCLGIAVLIEGISWLIS